MLAVWEENGHEQVRTLEPSCSGYFAVEPP